MTHIATMGAFSCACISIAGWSDNNVEAEMQYQDTGNVETWNNGKGQSPTEFYDNVLYPTDQNLGRTKDYPFSYLMEMINDSPLASKYMVAVLAEFQMMDDFWPELLLKHGFRLREKTRNEIGSINFIWVRNNNKKPIHKNESRYK